MTLGATEEARLSDLDRALADEALEAATPAELFSVVDALDKQSALKRALTNLVGNALKYGQAARIRLEPPSGRQNPVVRLFVEDDGPGVPEESQEAVFQPFRRLETSRNRETGGTGLGLPIARNILRAHGGDVTLENRAEGGLRAVVTLPV